MSQDPLLLGQDATAAGEAMHRLAAALYPICRSITGNGVRETLRRLQAHIPLIVHEVPSGTKVFDWTVPREWNITDAYIKNSAGDRIVDFRKSNLHLLGYSIPVHTRMSLAELTPHLITLPEQPDAIPYRTSYYNESWGFCLAHSQLLAMPEGEYEVRIDSSLTDGHLTYGECYLEGESEDEILISTHICHPSLGNDNLSGVASGQLIKKVYFPRLLVPIARVLSGAPDVALSFLLLVGLGWYYGLRPSPVALLWIPVFLVLALVTALAIGLWLSALNAKYRDIQHAVPLMIQLWFFATPIAYPASLLAERSR